MLGRHLDVVVLPPAVRLLILDTQVREMNLVIEIRQVVLKRPVADFVFGPIRMSVVVGAVAIPLVEPRLVLTLELVVEDDPFHPCAAVRQPLRVALVRAIDLDVVFQLALAFEAVPERLAVALVAVTMVFEHAASFLGQRDGMLAGAWHPDGLDQSLLAEVSQAA